MTPRPAVWLPALSVLVVLFSPAPLLAGQNDLARELRSALEGCARLIEEVGPGLADGAPGAAQVAQLGARLDDLQALHLLQQERHRDFAAHAGRLGGKATLRQQEMAESYERSMASLLMLLGRLVQDPGQARLLLPRIEELLQRLAPSRPLPIHGLLPYQPLNYPRRDPVAVPALTPAYQSTSVGSAPADLAATPEAPLSPRIAAHARAIAAASGRQNWDPVVLYEWVKNNVRTEWYHGCMKGAEETLRQKSGNDADQAALLVALLRAAGYPARYVRGVVEFFPGIEAARSQTGIDDPAAIGSFFQKAGIPFAPVLNGAEIVNYRIEHVWVEALIPYANYRGALADTQGPLWLPLDTSFKVAGYQESGSVDLYGLSGNPLPDARDSYLAASRPATPLEQLQSDVDAFLGAVAPGAAYPDTLHARALRDEVLRILPSAPQFNEIAVTGESAALPADLLHTARIRAATPAPAAAPVFDLTLPVHALSNRKLVVSFEPESVEDQEIINSWGGLDNTPGYLVRLRPVLLLDDERLAVGREGIASGGSFDLTVELSAPAGSATVTNALLAGYPAILGLVAQDVVPPDPPAHPAEATDLLYREALGYIDRWNRGEGELAQLLNLRTARPLPTLVTLGGAVEVDELLGAPQGTTWQGLYLDADLRAVESVPRTLVSDERQREFLRLSALQGSVLEGRVFEEAFGVASISTARLFGLAGDAGVPILAIDAANAEANLPTLPLADNVRADISAAVAAGQVVKVPAQTVAYHDWSGIGYLKEDPVTGAAGYMLSGLIAGGMTALAPDAWPYEFVYAFADPYAVPANPDPLAAYSIHKVGATDYQSGAAGEELAESLAVLVRDREGRPVKGAPVTFTVERGGGSLAGAALALTVNSDRKGIARTRLKLGANVMVESTTYLPPGEQVPSYARENTVSARLADGTSLAQPLVAIALPGAPAQLQPLNTQVTGTILAYAGEVGVRVLDRHGNPVANVPVRFTAGTPTPWHNSCPLAGANQDKLLAQLTTSGTCAETLPSWGGCATTGSAVGKTLSDGKVAAGVILGSYPDGLYPITAGYAGTGPVSLPTVNFTGYTEKVFENTTCGGNTPPSTYLYLYHEREVYRVRPAGTAVKVRVKAKALAEGVAAQPGTETLPCAPGHLACAQVSGNRAFDFVAPDSLRVTFNGSAGTPGATNPDLYEGDLTLAVGDNAIAVRAEAARTVSQYANSCGGCAAQPTAQIQPVVVDGAVNYTGVAIDMPGHVFIRLNALGFPEADVPVSYTIRPLHYIATFASLVVYRNDSIYYVANADTNEANTDILPRHLLFDPAASYSVQVVLNYGLGEAEIWSARVPVKTTLVDLDIDSDNNAGWQTDGTHRLPARGAPEEQIEGQAPGKVLLANRLDPDRDRVPGFADGIDLFGNQGSGASAPFVPVLLDVAGSFDPAQVRVRFAYDASSPSALTRTGDEQAGYVYAPAPGSLRLWSKDGGASRKAADLAQGGDFIAPGVAYTLAQLGTPVGPHTWQVYLEGVAATAAAQPIRMEIETVAGGVATAVGDDTVHASVVSAALVPDYDHNRTIDQTDVDRAGRGDTYYFWINDDDDAGETEGNDIPRPFSETSNRDCDNDAVDGMRDLIDFFPVTLDIAGLVQAFPPASHTYRLVSEAENLRVVFPELTNANAGAYLTVVDTARQLGAATSRKVRAGGIEALMAGEETLFNAVVGTAVNPGTPPVVLIEGVLAGTAPLRLTIANALGEVVARVELKLSVDGVEQMFRHKNMIRELSQNNELYLVGHPVPSDKGMADRGLGEVTSANPSGFTNPTHFLGFDAENDGNNFVHVHGYNVNDEDARGEQSELFKRLYWSGSRARFWGITWYGWDSQLSSFGLTPNYHVNVRHAFNTGRLLKDFVNQDVVGNMTVFAHSLGNMVVSTAIEEGMTVARYLMVNAAVAEEAYTPQEVYSGSTYEVGSSWRTSTKEPMFHPAWRYPDEVEIPLEQTYSPRVWASEWYKLFGNNDGRSTLTWRNRFAKVRDLVDTYVYYTPTDEAFRPFEYTVAMAASDPDGTGYQPNVDNWPGLEELFRNALSSTDTIGAYAWSSQELLKGRGGIPDSSAGGWGFNYNLADGYYQCEEPSSPEAIPNCTMIAPAAANDIEPSILRTAPLFSKNADHDPWGLYSDQPFSVFNTTLSKELLREELLANEIPAVTFAAGHRGVKEIKDRGDIRDVDIRDKFLVKKPGAPWPADRSRYEWRHSDVYNVAYPYLSGLYLEWSDKIKGDSQP